MASHRRIGGSAHWTVIRLHRELGLLVKTGPRHVSVSDPQAINTIYGVKPRFMKVGLQNRHTMRLR